MKPAKNLRQPASIISGGKSGWTVVLKPYGGLDIDCPNKSDVNPADLDIILATATKLQAKPPQAVSVAVAWHGQGGGYERYFLEKVNHGFRTANDLEIWRQIEVGISIWLEAEGYCEAVEILRGEIENNLCYRHKRTFDRTLTKSSLRPHTPFGQLD